jgi:hypothetical protein
MASLDAQAARRKIRSVLTGLGAHRKALALRGLTAGKLYELFVLSKLLLELRHRGHSFVFSHSTIRFKTGGGPIRAGDFHIDVLRDGAVVGKIYTDVEVRTLGSTIGTVDDFSQYHETDIVVVTPNASSYPAPDELLLGIECKATAKFLKSHVREVLGRRRELSYYRGRFAAPLGGDVHVEADPHSEYWLCFLDHAGLRYTQSPAVFSVELKHMPT